jgi:hypothetical protein
MEDDPMKTTVAGLCALSLLCACGGDAGAGGDGWAGSVRDSAGVTVVTNPEAGLWGAESPWTLVEEYRVGGMAAETDAQFGAVVGLDLDAAGNVYVADQQAKTIRVFSPEGDFLRSIGSPGQGPGEIGQALAAVFVVGDEVWAADVANQRVNRYALDGTVEGSMPLDFARGIPIRWDEIAGDRILVQYRNMAALGVGEDVGGDPLVFFGEEGGDTLAVLPEGLSLQMAGEVPAFRFFEAEPVWDASTDGRLTSAVNSGYRVEIRDADGTLERVVTRPFVPRAVQESDQQVMLDGIRDLMIEQGAPPQAVEIIMGQASFADHYPAFAQVLAGPAETLWMQRLVTPQDMAETGTFDLQNFGSDEWDVFDGEGRYLGVVAMPARFTPLRVTDDAFWGVQRDELDVPSVVRYRLNGRTN